MNRGTAAAVMHFAHYMLFEDSDEEDENIGILEKVENYAELSVPNFTDRQFQMHFRMSPNTFEDLFRKLHAVENPRTVSRGYPKMSLEKQAMIMIWCLSNLESFRSVADRFGISKSTCWSVLYRTCHLLLKVNKKFSIISWPSEERATKIIGQFAKLGMPGVIGAIDGSHVRIAAPKENHSSYVNRKSYHSVLLQGVCDDRMLFTDVYAGEAGSIHDYTLFKRSDLYARIRAHEAAFPNDSHLIGDLAYKLSETLLVGFKNNGNLSRRQKNFNFTLSKCRVTIENAYALLKGRFRRLKLLETVRLDLISLLIISACIMHNVCILRGDLLEDIINIEDEAREEGNHNPNNFGDLDEHLVDNNAVVKRNNIVNALPVIIRDE